MKRVFLTGASSGIGLAIARELSANGHEVWGTSRDVARLPALEHFHPVQLDLAAADSIAQSFAIALQEAGQFDVLINNAGNGHFGAAEDLPAAMLHEQFQVLVFGHIQLMQLVLPLMRARNSGLIINVTSLASRIPVPFMGAYNAAKAAMASFTMSAQLELAQAGVRIVDLQPADIATNFNGVVARPDARDSAYAERIEKTWRVVDRNMRNAPPPELVARAVSRLIASGAPPPRITVGDFFQSRVAPFLDRFLPQRVRLWGIRKYYDL